MTDLQKLHAFCTRLGHYPSRWAIQQEIERMLAEERAAGKVLIDRNAIEPFIVKLMGQTGLREVHAALSSLWTDITKLPVQMYSEPDRAIAEESTRAQTAPQDGYWWCPNCVREVHPAQVTFEEAHEVCGARVEWMDAPEREAYDRLRQAAEWCEARGNELYAAFYSERSCYMECARKIREFMGTAFEPEREVTAADLGRTFARLTAQQGARS